MCRWSSLLLLLVLPCALLAQPALSRRVFLGIRMEPLTDDMRRILNVGDTPAVLVSEVLPNSTAEKAKWRRGDLLTRLNDQAVGSTAEVMALLAAQTSGKPFTYTLLREGRTINGKSTFAGWPEEHYADLSVEYTAVKAAAGVQRVIITRPRDRAQQRLPVVLFLTGIGCYSVDAPLDTARSETRLLNTLARAGYACVRVDKPGIGDGAATSEPCSAVSFMNDMDGYVQALRQLKQRPDIDSTSICLFGHSMGGVMAPMVAARTPVQHIVAYGTIGSNFIEYLAKTRRTIGQAYGQTPEEVDDLVKTYCTCASWYFADKMTTDQAAAKDPSCAELLRVFDLRSRAYNDELYALNIPGLWKNYTGRALFLWGESDCISAKEDHEILATAMEFYHPGRGRFKAIPHADHAMQTAADFAAARAGDGPYEPAVASAVLQWLRE